MINRKWLHFDFYSVDYLQSFNVETLKRSIETWSVDQIHILTFLFSFAFLLCTICSMSVIATYIMIINPIKVTRYIDFGFIQKIV